MFAQVTFRARSARRLLLLALLLGNPVVGNAASNNEPSVLVAVATNFAATAERIRDAFADTSNARVRLSTGSTGKLFAQIHNGAPYDLLLAADQERPQRLEQLGLTVPGTRVTYAVGALVLWSSKSDLVAEDGITTLQRGAFRRLAIANPDLAPYGAAARQTLQRLSLFETLQHKIVRGENIGQTYAMVASGNAELGFVASTAVSDRNRGSQWTVPAHCHEPIVQQAVLLQRGADNPTATAFLKFLTGTEATTIIAQDGFRVHGRH